MASTIVRKGKIYIRMYKYSKVQDVKRIEIILEL